MEVFTAHQYSGTADQSGTVTLTNRLVEHQYSDVGIDDDLATANAQAIQTTPVVTAAGADDGYTLVSELWANAILQVSDLPVTLIWKAVVSDVAPRGQ